MNRWRWHVVVVLFSVCLFVGWVLEAPARLIRALFVAGRWVERPYRYAVLRSCGWRVVGGYRTKGRPANRRTARL